MNQLLTNLVKRFRELTGIPQRLADIRLSIENQTEAIREQSEATKQHTQPQPVVRAELQVAQTINTHKVADDTNSPWREWLKVIIEAATLCAVIAYACLTRNQWHSMQESNSLTQQSLNVAQRAYVTIGRKDGTVAEFIDARDAKEPNAGLVIYFQNSGHLPAKFNWSPLMMSIIPSIPGVVAPHTGHKWAPMTRFKNRKDGSTGESGTDTIGGDSLDVADVGELPKDTVLKLIHHAGLFQIMGRYEYCDALGNYSCKDFFLYFQDAPYNSFRLEQETACSAEEHALAKPDPDLEYLPPCETLKEQTSQK